MNFENNSYKCKWNIFSVTVARDYFAWKYSSRKWALGGVGANYNFGCEERMKPLSKSDFHFEVHDLQMLLVALYFEKQQFRSYHHFVSSSYSSSTSTETFTHTQIDFLSRRNFYSGKSLKRLITFLLIALTLYDAFCEIPIKISVNTPAFLESASFWN